MKQLKNLHKGFDYAVLTLLSGWLLLYLAGCSTTRFVPENEYLLTNVKVKSRVRDITKEKLKPYVRQTENTKLLGFWKFYLGLYNLSGRNEDKGINRWLRSIGEEPVIFDPYLVTQSARQMKLYLNNQGFFQASVNDTVIYQGKKKAKVIYSINPGLRYYLNDVTYSVEDDSIQDAVLGDTLKTFLRKDQPFTVEIHEKERERISKNLRNSGFYKFSEEFIYFVSDTTIGENLVNDSVIVMTPEDISGQKHHQKYRINKVLFQVGIGTDEILKEDSGKISSGFDTLKFEGIQIVFDRELPFKPQLLISSSFIKPGDYYHAARVERTHQSLSSLRLFRYINIRFRETGNTNERNEPLLDCIIGLSPGKPQSFSIDIEGTNSSGNIGAAGSFNYQHKNLLKGGEYFTLNARLARENQFVRSSSEEFNTLEIGGEASVVVPRFWLPLRAREFRQRYNPKTNISLSYNYQHRPDYTRTFANARLGYNWRSSRYISHSFYPLEFNLVNIPKLSDDFKETIKDTYLEYTYEDHLIVGMNYSFLLNQQTLGQSSDFWYFRANVESAGNLLSAIMSPWDEGGSDNYAELFGIRYAQYVKSDIDLRFHNRIDKYTSLVWRLFAGVGLPYGNLNVLPFEKKYFSGGANSIRAWPVRSLGPGSYSEKEYRFYNQTGDIKLEMNLEYRFKLFWVLEGALFLDAGNIWGIRESSSPEGGLFEADKFLEQIAVGTGIGARFDFNYFIFRLDMGLKTRDPSLLEGERWIPLNRPWEWTDASFNFAIGYPF
ncbi:translocation and assembly module lipoprotein TamL [Thermophagus sp. OGC60D27]|uniref:translocation and assembly module lipoprotein TamL n=1 Tax=Thermophagus sp. OGC60D27 TaxID=3458415 RepID=UPI00403811A5